METKDEKEVSTDGLLRWNLSRKEALEKMGENPQEMLDYINFLEVSLTKETEKSEFYRRRATRLMRKEAELYAVKGMIKDTPFEFILR